MPAYLAGEKKGLLEKLLVVVFAKVEVRGWWGVEVQDVIGGVEL